ncbi:MAG: transketolase C-terminal domain-containing protein, partial [Candidatus Bathyarchaeia archaeon]
LHDEKGQLADREEAEKLILRLDRKIRRLEKYPGSLEVRFMENAKAAIVSYGTSARASLRAVVQGRAKGLEVGWVRLKQLSPFPEEVLLEILQDIRKVVVPEMNLGQIGNEVQKVIGKDKVTIVPKVGGFIHKPEEILNPALEAFKQ